MAVSDSAKVDLLYKKLFGVAKTDLPANKSPSNEAIASPALIRGDNIWQQVANIPGVATATVGIVQAYTGASAVQCTADTTSTPISSVYPSWKTNLTDWIPSEFGSTYFVQVWVDSSGVANPTSTGTQIFDSGIAGIGEWNFDYQSGVLNFIGGTIPAALTSGKVIYVVGYRYIGLKGVSAFGNVTFGNISVTGNISGNLISGNSYISSTEVKLQDISVAGNVISSLTTDLVFSANLTDPNNIVRFDSVSALDIAAGTTAQRPPNPDPGYVRYNTDITTIEWWNGTEWTPGSKLIESEIIVPDGINATFTLGQSTMAEGILVNINGTIQQAYSGAYLVAGNQITFSEIPQVTDIIEIRYLSAGMTSASWYGGTIVNPVHITAMTPTTSSTTGALTVHGGVGFGSNLTIAGNTTVTGGIRKSARVLTTTTILTVADASGFIEFAGSGTYTVTLPDPTQAASSGIGYRFWQNTADNITLSTPAGAFYGPSGSSTSTKVLAQATTQYWDVWTDGYNWAVFGIKIA
jgi:hypothetical protein